MQLLLAIVKYRLLSQLGPVIVEGIPSEERMSDALRKPRSFMLFTRLRPFFSIVASSSKKARIQARRTPVVPHGNGFPIFHSYVDPPPNPEILSNTLLILPHLASADSRPQSIRFHQVFREPGQQTAVGVRVYDFVADPPLEIAFSLDDMQCVRLDPGTQASVAANVSDDAGLLGIMEAGLGLKRKSSGERIFTRFREV